MRLPRQNNGRNRTHGPALRKLSGLTEQLIAPGLRQRGQILAKLVASWPEIAGDTSSWCLPADIRFSGQSRRQGTLSLCVASGRGPQIQMLAPQLIEKVNQLFGYAAIEKTRIRQDFINTSALNSPVQSSKDSIKQNKASTLTLSRIEKATAQIENPELRASLIRLGKSLS